jgi:hypothetical protein
LSLFVSLSFLNVCIGSASEESGSGGGGETNPIRKFGLASGVVGGDQGTDLYSPLSQSWTPDSVESLVRIVVIWVDYLSLDQSEL